MAADHFCLRWNNHQSTLVSVFDDLLESETLVDCTLAADGKYLKAHKVVLSACSPYLGMILSQHYDQHPIIILKDVKYEEMKAMLDYMYRGEVNISQEHLATFLKAAESLQIKGLTDTSSLNEEANKKQLQVERPPSSAESTTSAPTNDETFSREGSCSPTPKKRKQEVLCKNNVESDENVKQVRAGITDVVSDLSVRNSVSSKFKLSSSDVAKNSVHVKSEPMDEPLYDGFMPSNVQGSEDGVKGIPRAGPSNGSNSSIVGSPWLMSVDSTGDEGKLGSEQDFENTKKSDGETSSVKKMCVDMNPVVGLRVLRPEELGLNIGRSSCNENKTCEANKRTVSESCNSFDNDDILKDFFKELKTMVQGGARKIVFQIKRTDPQCATATSVCEVSTSDDDDCVIIAEPDVEKKDILESSVAITPNVNQESKIVEQSLNESKASDARSNFQPTNPNSHSIYQPANSASTSGSNSPCVSQSDMFSPNVLTPILSIEPTKAYQQICTINSVNSNLVCKKDNPSVMKLTSRTMAALGFVPQPYPKNKHHILKYTRPQRLILPATDKPSATQPVYKVAQPVQPQPQPQPVVYPQYILSTNDTNQFNQNAVTNQQVGQHINQPMVILNPNQTYVTNLQPFQ